MSNQAQIPGTQAHQFAVHLRREVDIILQATGGVGSCSLLEAIATAAVVADKGQYQDLRGNIGYAWDPRAQQRKNAADPVTERIKAAGASLGRIMVGGHPNYRTYQALLEGIYEVAVSQNYDVAQRIERLWEEYEVLQEEDRIEEDMKKERLSLTKRIWNAILRWWKKSYHMEVGE